MSLWKKKKKNIVTICGSFHSSFMMEIQEKVFGKKTTYIITSFK